MKYRLAAALFAAAAAPAAAQTDYDAVEITATPVAEGVFMLEGAGGNIGLSVGDEGAFVIDDQFAPLSDKIMAAIAEITDQPVKFVLNTHYHGDHTGGNEAFGEAGAYIVAHDNVRVRLASGDQPAPEAALPVITFSETTTFHMNGEEIHVMHPENAHTDGDAIIFFRKANAVHMGDTMFAGRFPYIDVASGGSLDGAIAALETTAGMIDAETKIIPGHGPVSTKADIEKSITMLKDVRARIQALIDKGLDEDAVVAAAPLADLEEAWSWRFINAERMTRSAYQSLTQ